MANARIYRPSSNIMQSGKAQADQWVLEYEPTDRKTPDSLMGWSGSSDLHQQIKLTFDSCDEAQAYADRAGIDAEVTLPTPTKKIYRNYADRFAVDRVR